MVAVCGVVALAGCAKRPPGAASVPPGTPTSRGSAWSPSATATTQMPNSPASRQGRGNASFPRAGPVSRCFQMCTSTTTADAKHGMSARSASGSRGRRGGGARRPTSPSPTKVFNQDITGIVTNTPGTYSLQFALDAYDGRSSGTPIDPRAGGRGHRWRGIQHSARA